MKKWILKGCMLVFSMLLLLTGCSKEEETPEMTGQIYLYGESHGNEVLLAKEFELWESYYNQQGMRHLFVELPYYTAELMNVWMQEEDDEILEAIFFASSGTLGSTSYDMDFYIKIKENCPKTVFHGTDVGHQYDTTGAWYLKYLRDNGLEESEQYKLAEENIQQGIMFYAQDVEMKISADAYREMKMTENFIREYEALNGQDIMGIYGAAHTSLDSLNYTSELDCMGTQLFKKYGDKMHSEDLYEWAKADSTIVEILMIDGKEYEALYFGETSFMDQKVRFWRVEGAYEDFKDYPATGNVADYSFYPMNVEPGQVFVIDYEAADGTVTRTYHYDRGLQLEGWSVTEEFVIE